MFKLSSRSGERTQTLLKEYKERDKSNVFKDKRFGEYSSDISPEEKMLKRFALEQQRQHEKKSIYNLNEDEELTHYGQSLADIEKHNDIVDSDSDSEDRGALSAELTAAHFGGGDGLLYKKTSQQQGEEGEKPKSRKELIEELIAKSKQEKVRQFLLSVLRRRRHTLTEMVLSFFSRMKTKEELAEEAQARLRRLEAERLRRMLGKDEDERTKNPKHVSADDLSDGFILDKDDRRVLSYKDGKMNVEEELGGEASASESTEEEEEGSGEEGDPEESDGPDGHSDLESDVGSEDGGERAEEDACLVPGDIAIAHDGGAREAARTELPYTLAGMVSLFHGFPPGTGVSLIARRQQFCRPRMHIVRVQSEVVLLPKVLPREVRPVGEAGFSGHGLDPRECQAGTLLRVVWAFSAPCPLLPTCWKLFGFLLEYIGDLATEDPPGLGIIDKLVVHLYNLCQMFPDSASDSMKFVLRDAMHEMEATVESTGRAAFPGLDVCPVLSLRDVLKGLFVCCVFLDYVSLSQRFIPELVNFLLGILYIATPKKQSQGYTLVHPFRALGRNSELLVVSDKEDMATWQRRRLSLHWAAGPKAQTKTEANHTRLSCLAVCLALVERCVRVYGALPSFHDIELGQSALTEMESHARLCRPLVCEKSKPVPLKLFTPRLVRVLEFGRKQGSSKEEQERKRLIHKHKREFRGAVREIRRDNQFLARMQLSEITERILDRCVPHKSPQPWRWSAPQTGRFSSSLCSPGLLVASYGLEISSTGELSCSCCSINSPGHRALGPRPCY
ncbi:nucleolar protein 14 [Camelus ferus]|nr:nucleolar protein 14 [Camelus ferus]EPY83785.1 nucleolar protein 14 [Camelus ferus]